MTLPSISIEQFRRQSLSASHYFNDNMIVTNRVDQLKRLQSPCRISAITVSICIGGRMECSVNLKRYDISQDMILVCFPEDVIQIHQSEHLEAYTVMISRDYLNQLEIDFKQRTDFYMGYRNNAVCSLPHERVLALHPFFALLSESICHQHSETAEVLRGLTHAFCYTIMSLSLQFHSENDDEEDKLNRNKQVFDKFLMLVKNNHYQHREVNYYAGQLCLTPNYMSGVIKACSGRTALEWINDYVVLEAKIMLRNSEATIQQIAFSLNFPNQSGFGKYFKKIVGVRPKDYRMGKFQGDDAE